MKAILLKDTGSIAYESVADPVLKSGEVLVRVKASGICGSDVKRVYKDGAHNMPLVIGHEFAGIVEATGDNVTRDLKGKRVAVFPLIPCRECAQCRSKKYEMCEHYDYLGSRSNGGMSEYVSVPEWNLMEIPDTVTYEQAAMMEPMAVAVHAMRKVDIKEDDNIVVCGLGTIGILLSMFLSEKGYKNLFLIGNKDVQKRAAREIGIDEKHFCDVRFRNAQEYISSNTSGQGANVYFECVGTNTAINNAIKSMAASGKICYVGNPGSDIEIDMNTYWKILRKQLSIAGTWNSSFYGEEQIGENMDDWKYCISRLGEGLIHPEKIITHRYSMEKLIEGLEIMRDKKEEYLKVMGINAE